MLGDAPWTVFTAGLLHDVGKTALALSEGQRYSALIADVGKSGTALEQGEQACFGFGHSEIGARLLQRWGVPPEISSIVQYHHFLEWPDSCKRTCSIVHLANSVSHSLDGKEISLPSNDMDKRAMSELELTPDDLSEIVSRTQVELEDLKGIFFPAAQT
jgi:putative nucleotidyltransferase with HDIG domain